MSQYLRGPYIADTAWQYTVVCFAASLSLLLANGLLPAAPPPENGETQQQASDAAQEQLELGNYLVHHVAMCVQCHSPRNDQGELIPSRLFHGGRIPLDRPYAEHQWALKAPRLAGLPGWEDGALVQLLTNGKRDNALAPRPPMPPFRLTKPHAMAIITYLRSLD